MACFVVEWASQLYAEPVQRQLALMPGSFCPIELPENNNDLVVDACQIVCKADGQDWVDSRIASLLQVLKHQRANLGKARTGVQSPCLLAWITSPRQMGHQLWRMIHKKRMQIDSLELQASKSPQHRSLALSLRHCMGENILTRKGVVQRRVEPPSHHPAQGLGRLFLVVTSSSTSRRLCWPRRGVSCLPLAPPSLFLSTLHCAKALHNCTSAHHLHSGHQQPRDLYTMINSKQRQCLKAKILRTSWSCISDQSKLVTHGLDQNFSLF